MFLHYLFYLLILISQLTTIHSDCSFIELCTCDTNKNVVICDANYGNQTDNDYFSSFSLLPSVEKYIFRNFQQIQSHAFQNMTFLTNNETHECNCIVDLFFNDTHIPISMNDSLIQPTCIFNTTRTHCDIQSQLIISKCSINKPNPDGSDTNNDNGGNYKFIGIMVGMGGVLLILLAVGSSIAYRRRRKSRRGTIIDMEEPIENPLAVIIEERLNTSH
ncbi:unnamed protein product [Rotaria sp. Silwood2]|nr:unnamed protein product [Rotaria sp. Silwood2]